MSTPSHALGVEVHNAGKSFGAFRALDNVSITVRPGTVHALLGENGAGKSTLVKGLVGYGLLDEGQISAGGREVRIASPRDAQALGIGMVYQHFTLASGLSVEENLLLARGRLPWKIQWKAERAALEAFMQSMPFRLPLDAPVSGLAAGEKQKLEILKQLYLQQRFLILDEPTSVLTPQEADEVLGLMRNLTTRGELTVLMITHKFREVMAYADDVTVLRKGRQVGTSAVSATSRDALAGLMMGAAETRDAAVMDAVTAERVARKSVDAAGRIRLAMRNISIDDDRGHAAVKRASLAVRSGEILGIAGVSGNGQKELVEALVGQRRVKTGEMEIAGDAYHATREEMTERRVFAIPEEPLKNACVASMSVAQATAQKGIFSESFTRRREQLSVQASTVRVGTLPPDWRNINFR